jgi:hypothetical protein
MSEITVKQTTIINLLSSWLARQVEQGGFDWLKQQQQKITFSSSKRVFFTNFSAVPRYMGKQKLQLNEAEIQTARAKCPGWSPQFWRVDQAARSLLVLSLAQGDRKSFPKTLEQVFATADVGELVALYQMLPLLPCPQQYRLRAAEGIRSNMTVVFNAVSLHNPYPAKYLDESAWNQMVLKALFVGSSLYSIQGLDRRANRTLSKMLIDYALERWAAKRSVSLELWRAMGKFADETITANWERVLAHSEPVERKAIAFACAKISNLQASNLQAQYFKLQESIDSGDSTWTNITEDSVSN